MNDYYNNSFFARMKQTVYKWWCVIYKPVYKLTHHGYWPASKEPVYTQATTAQTPPPQDMTQISQPDIPQSTPQDISSEVSEISEQISEPEIDLSTVSEDALARANEIMERLAREAAEDEAKKQSAIDAAKKKADDDARLASILKSTERDISAYIAEGMAHREENQKKETGVAE